MLDVIFFLLGLFVSASPVEAQCSPGFHLVPQAQACHATTPPPPVCPLVPGNNQMAILQPCVQQLVTFNQVTTPGLIGISLTDANALVAQGSVPITVKAPGAGAVEVWTHNALRVTLTAGANSTFTGNLNLASEPAGPIKVSFKAWNNVAPHNSPTLFLHGQITLWVNGTRQAPSTPAPAVSAGFNNATLYDNFSSLNSTPCKPGTGVWPSCTDPTASDGFKWYEGLFTSLDFGDCANEHTDSPNGYNPFTILPMGGLRIRNTFDPAYIDPYGFNRKQRCGMLGTGFKDRSSSVALQDGYYDARVLVPNSFCNVVNDNVCSGGTWPSWWMLDLANGTNGNIELDMMEMYGNDPQYHQAFTHAYGTAFYPFNPQGGYSGYPLGAGSDLTWDWHTVGMLVTATGSGTGTVCTYFDEVQLNCGSVPQYGGPDANVKPFWAPMIELASGGGWVSNPPPSNQYDYYVDWVGVWTGAAANGFFISPTGNDGNPGTLGAPFATFTRAQTAMRASSTVKTTFVRSGNYTPATASANCNGDSQTCILDLQAADHDETWSYYPPDGYGSANITGGATTVNGGNGLFYGITVNAPNITIDGLNIHNVQYAAVRTTGNSSGLIIRNNTFTDQMITTNNADPGMISCSNCSGSFTISHNNIQRAGAWGIKRAGANPAGNIMTVDHNYFSDTCTGRPDCSAIYRVDTNQTGSGTVWTNNYIHNGNTGATLGSGSGEAMYMDDCASGATVTGNIVTGRNGTNTAMLFHGGHDIHVEKNIIDLSNLGQFIVSLQGDVCANSSMSGNTIRNNIIISSNDGGQFNTLSGPINTAPTVTGNLYFNYAGSAISSGGNWPDSNPTTANPQLSCWTYVLAGGSPAFNSPVNFTDFTRDWGPPGFVIPQIGIPPSSSVAGCSGAPADILASAGTPAVVAYSMNRRLSASYSGPLFQAVRASDSATQNIGQTSGVVNSATYDAFCASTTCYMKILYDQGPSGLNMTAIAGNGATGSAALVRRIVLTNGKVVFNAEKESNGGGTAPQRPPVGYETGTRAGGPNNGGMPGSPGAGQSVPITVYWMLNGLLAQNNCCYTFGDAESFPQDFGPGHMFANALGNNPSLGGILQAIDIEEGAVLLSGVGYVPHSLQIGISKSDGLSVYSSKTADAQSGTLTTWHTNTPLPADHTPLHLEGGITLMQGGAADDQNVGGFYEGYIVASQTSNATDDAIQASNVGFYGPP